MSIKQSQGSAIRPSLFFCAVAVLHYGRVSSFCDGVVAMPRKSRRFQTPSPYDVETIRKLRAIEASDSILITAWESKVMNTVFEAQTMTGKQRAQALWIVAKYEPFLKAAEAKQCSPS